MKDRILSVTRNILFYGLKTELNLDYFLEDYLWDAMYFQLNVDLAASNVELDSLVHVVDLPHQE